MTLIASSTVVLGGAASAGADQIGDPPASRMCLIHNIGDFNNLACEKVVTAPSLESENADASANTAAAATVSSYPIRNHTTDLTLVFVRESGTLVPAPAENSIAPGASLIRQAEDNTTATTDATAEYSLQTAVGTDLGHLTITMDNGRVTSCSTTAPGTACSFNGDTTTITHDAT
ncbi:hypothetical protein [Streptomyces sp. NBC_01264]|uniref:hypothetical protein n=1 Tax=Streptomyces sp. NBC_01264 TaxID=2903804 RepID=UPI00225A7A27|nr:hypothetical protein [Streptomyces sp. NBC_01264]MCX4784248.1 hypothetical protein [Streptomyces sp. NBC_01264]